MGLFEHPDDHDIHVIMTVRSRRLRKHAGEVCFPVSPFHQSVRLSVSRAIGNGTARMMEGWTDCPFQQGSD